LRNKGRKQVWQHLPNCFENQGPYRFHRCQDFSRSIGQGSKNDEATYLWALFIALPCLAASDLDFMVSLTVWFCDRELTNARLRASDVTVSLPCFGTRHDCLFLSVSVDWHMFSFGYEVVNV
jgi:hypothetical protein